MCCGGLGRNGSVHEVAALALLPLVVNVGVFSL
jgi:hypothetical protein